MSNIEEKIRLIENSNDINELTLDVLPPTYNENYYFVSYSHKDYKKVYKDILLLQEKGLSLWYDRGMRPGKDWKEIAETMIDKYTCKGVIFYISENSLSSDACAEEIEYVNKIGKSFCSINLMSSDNNFYSAAEMCEKIEISETNKKIIQSIFSPKVLFLKEDDSIEKKVEGILKLKEPQLLLYTFAKMNDYARLVERGITDIYDGDIPEDDLPFIKNCMFHYATISFTFDQSIKVLHIPDTVYSNMDGTICEDINDHSIKNKIIALSRCCFTNCRRLTDVIMNDSIESIGESAFQGCINLERFIISKNVTKINSFTFLNCLNLNNINFPNVTHLGYGAFKGCRNLKDLNLEGCNTISNSTFADCTSLKKIKLNITEIPENAFENCAALEEIVLPNVITYLGENSFFKCKSLKTIEAAFDIKEIPYLCFYGCEKLKEIKFNDSLTTIAISAFSYCKSLESIDFGTNLETINQAAFDGCVSLEKLHFSDNLKYIGNVAFNNCKNIKEIYFGENLSEIGMGAFAGCESLKEIILPESVTYIGDNAFARCVNLEKIVIPRGCKCVANTLLSNDKLSKIIYTGTIEEWKQIKGYNYMRIDNRKYEVICIDGIYNNL